MGLRLGEALVKEGLVTNQQLAKALERQVIYGGRLGTNFIELGYLTEESLVKFLGKVFGLPYADPKAFEGIKREIVDAITPEMAERYLVIPIDREPKRLHLAMVNPTDLRVIDEIRFITGFEIVPYIASELRLLYALERYFGIRRQVRFISPIWPIQLMSDARNAGPEVAAAKGTALASELAGTETAPEAKPLDKLSQRLVEAKDREEIASVILESASASLKRVALFVVKSNSIVGWKGSGDQLSDEMMVQIELPLHQPSIFRTVIDGKGFYRGTLSPVPQNLHFLEMMGKEIPQEAIAFPLTIKGRVVCILYGDDGDKSLLLGDFEELKRVLLKASMALEMLILKKKILEM
jgi:hypothetical protein